MICVVRGTRSEFLHPGGPEYKVRGPQYEVRGLRSEVRGMRSEVVRSRRYHSQVRSPDFILL